MKSLATHNYIFINEEDVLNEPNNHFPIFKVKLYGEMLKEGPSETIYIKLLSNEIENLIDYEQIIRLILKKQLIGVLAFGYEQIGITTNQDNISTHGKNIVLLH